MSQSTVVTPQMERVRALADQALLVTEGITIVYKVSKYGSLAACKTASRGMQVAFSSLRVRARRTSQRISAEPSYELLANTRGKYDSLACVVRPMPNDEGYTVGLIPSYSFDMDLEIIDNATGEQLKGEDPNTNRFLVLVRKWLKAGDVMRKDKTPFVFPFTPEEESFFWKHDPETAREFYEAVSVRIPALFAMKGEDGGSEDLASLDESELEMDEAPEIVIAPPSAKV